MEANFMGNDAVDCVRKEGGCNTQTDMISRLVLFFFLGQIHLSLTDKPSVKCVIKKTFLFFIRIQ